jgi:hypothetical protein
MRITSSGKVGIGTSSPAQALQVGDGSAQHRIRVVGSGSPGLEFNDSGTAVVLGGANTLDTYTSGINRMRIDSSGKVGIGITSPIVKLDVAGRIRANAIYPSITAGGGTSGSSGEYWKLGSLALYGSQSAKIRVGGTQSYSSGSNISGETTIHFRGSNNTSLVSGHFYGNTQGNPMVSDVCYKQTSNDVFDIYIRTFSTFSGLDTWVDCAGNWTPALSNTGSTSAPSGSVALPSLYTVSTNGNERIRVDSDGLKFNGDTAAANALDDYEEGTWTPTFSTSGFSSTGVTWGRYQKIGNQVTLWCQMYGISSPADGTRFDIYGIPYNTSNTQGRAMGSVMFNGVNFTGTNTQAGVVSYLTDGGPSVYFLSYADNSGWSSVNADNISTGDHVMFTISYRTDA